MLTKQPYKIKNGQHGVICGEPMSIFFFLKTAIFHHSKKALPGSARKVIKRSTTVPSNST
jgi:hypothetical protein